MARIASALLTLLAAAQAPAVASSPATAVVTPQSVVAGTENLNFTFTVYNPRAAEGGTGPLHAVRVFAPGGSDGSILFAPLRADATGWVASVDGRAATFAGGSVDPGEAEAFQVKADVARPTSDTEGTWAVEVSSDGGDTFEPAVPAALGLTTQVRTLEMTSVSTISPNGTVDGSVTEGQSSVCIRSVVANEGGIGQTVTPSLSGDRVEVAARKVANADPCEGPALGGAGMQIAAGGSQAFDFELRFGGPGPTVVTASASSAGSSAEPRSIPFQIQPAPDLAVTERKPRPEAVRPDLPFHLTLDLGKSNGTPAGVLRAEGSFFRVEGCPATYLDRDYEFAPGASTVEVRFEQCSSTAPDGSYDLDLTLRFMDENGAVTSTAGPTGKRLVVDGFAPLIDATISDPPPSRIPGSNAAFKDGDRIRVEVSVRDRDPSGMLGLCQQCSVDVDLESYGGGNPLGGAIGLVEEGGNGSYSAEHTLAVGPSATAARFRIQATDLAGNRTTVFSDLFEIDNRPPRILEAVTTTVGETPRAGVRVTFSECIGGNTSPLEWRIDGLPPLSVSAPLCSGQGKTEILMTAARQLPPDDPAGQLAYEPLPAPIGTPLFDRVGWPVGPANVQIHQG